MDEVSLTGLERAVCKTAAMMGVVLEDETIRKMSFHGRLVLEANEYMNLTRITGCREMAAKHIIDSVMLGQKYPPPEGEAVDIGSGAGFPGIPLAISHPKTAFWLIEARMKRVQFLQTVKEKLGLNIAVMHERAEAAARGELRERFDWAAARAVAPLDIVLEYGLPLIRKKGIFVVAQGPAWRSKAEAAAAAARALGGELIDEIGFDLPYGLGRRCLLVYAKYGVTPEKYPRSAKRMAQNPFLGCSSEQC